MANLDGPPRAVRDSKNPTGVVLSFTVAAWSAFTAGVRAGRVRLIHQPDRPRLHPGWGRLFVPGGHSAGGP